MRLIICTVIALVIGAGCDDRTAKEVGEDLAQEKVDLVSGAGEVVKEQGEKVANTVAQGVGNVLSGIAKGFDESLVQKEIRVDETLQQIISVNRAQSIDSRASERKGLSLYVTSDLGVSQKLLLLGRGWR